MRRLVRKVFVLAALIAVASLVPALLSLPSPAGTPYVSALSTVVVPAMAATTCENKHCYIAPDGNQSKCVDNALTRCVITSVHGRGHGRICTTYDCSL